ncbi:MAG: hypothetical protein IJH55_00635 [Romboutsia sp.]|nr:hypothetical protein [Romboutsia sp.]
MNEYKFNTREEVINFLDKYNFNYYIPRLGEYMDNIKDDLKSYYVEVSDLGEVIGCYIVSITDGKEYKEQFFDAKKIDEFKDTAYNKDYRDKNYEDVIQEQHIRYKPGKANEFFKYKSDIDKEYF